jgi:TolB-like protein/DNA-binding winged helix-turn-helix (wHTH) protein/tetratricopeptide (TPR) repeat protein
VSEVPAQPDSFELDTERYELRRGERVLRLEKIPMELLILLAQRKDQLVGRREIIEKLWGKDVFLDTEQGINTAIRKIRLALHEDPEEPRFLQTVVGKGYRLVGPITLVGNGHKETRQRPPVASGPAANSIPRQARFWIIASVISCLAISAAVVIAIINPGLRDRLFNRNPSIHSIAVLPLENLSGDASQDYFADGMTDELITNLAKIKALRVISRTSVMQYKSVHKSLPEIAQALNVSAVVEGAVSRSGNRVHITAQLIDARNDVHLWAQEFDRDMGDTTALQSEIAQTIAHQIRVEMTTGDETRLSSRHQVSAKAHDAYLQGRYQWNKKTGRSLTESISFYQHAIAEDPDYALAYAGLADSYIVLENNGKMSANEANPQIKAAALRAVEADASLADGHMVLASVRENEWDWVGAEQEYKRALELNPGLARAHHWYAILLTALHRPGEAIHEIARAVDLEPVTDSLYLVESQIYYRARQYENAERSLHMVVGTDKESTGVHETIGLIDLGKTRYHDAVSELLISARQEPGEPEEWALLTYAYAQAGEKSEALHAFARITQLGKKQFVEPCWMAVAWTGLGNRDKAIYYLNEAYQTHSNVLPFLQVDPIFDPLRSDARFQELLHRMALPV